MTVVLHSDLGNAERLNLLIASGGAARLRLLKRRLRSAGEGGEPMGADLEMKRPAAVGGELQHRGPAWDIRTKQQIFDDFKVSLRQRMVDNGASAEAIADLDSIEWGQDDGFAPDAQANPARVCIDGDGGIAGDHRDLAPAGAARIAAAVQPNPDSAPRKAGGAA